MPEYDDSLTLREALAIYFEANGFGDDGGYSDTWVYGKFGPVPFAFPNTPARRRAVPLHDIHHVVTGYDTDGVGEGAIGAWEVASGCERHWVAWLLDLNAMAIAFFLDWRAVWRGFKRGRRSRNYYTRSVDDALLATKLGTARRELLCAPDDSGQCPSTLVDRATFVGWLATGLLSIGLQVGLLLAPIAWLAWWLAA